MRIRVLATLSLAVCAALVSAAAPRAAGAQTPSPELPATANPTPANDTALSALLAKMNAVNSDLRSYEADIKVDVKMRTFPYLSPTLTGRVYWERPDRSAVVFDALPVLANQFKKVYPRIEAPSRWESIYRVALISDDRVRLVPRKHGRIDHIDVVVNPNATIASMHWFYNDGGDVALSQVFGTIAGRTLVKTQHGIVDLPSYKGDIAATFTDYRINVKVPEGIFTS